MIRTQIYLTEKEKLSLDHLAKALGKSQSELIRQAIDIFCDTQLAEGKLVLMRRAKGIWKNRKDLPDFKKLRDEMNR